MKCFNIDVRIYSTCASSSLSFCFCFCVFHPGFFWWFCLFVCCCCHFDIDICIYSTRAFLIVKWILMLIMYSAANLYIFTGYSAV